MLAKQNESSVIAGAHKCETDRCCAANATICMEV